MSGLIYDVRCWVVVLTKCLGTLLGNFEAVGSPMASVISSSKGTFQQQSVS